MARCGVDFDIALQLKPLSDLSQRSLSENLNGLWDACAFRLTTSRRGNSNSPKGEASVQRSGIGDNLRSIPTHKHTLQSLNNPAVFIMGDATNLPGSKAGSVAHMKVITCLRDQQAKGASLTIRSMGKSSIVTTKELYDLFSGGPLKKPPKIAGIHKPVGCI